MTARKSWTEQIRAALTDHVGSDRGTYYRVAVDTGIRHSRLWDFVQGKNLHIDNLEKLAEYLGFSLILKRRKIISENG